MILVFKKNMIITIAAILLFVALINVWYFSSVTTSALPSGNKVVILDPGHGGEDGGAVGASGVVEKNLNLQVALKVQAMLEQNGCTVFMTRTDDTSTHDLGEEKKGNRKISDLNNRKKLAQNYKIDAYVSIHMNSFTNPKYYGSQVFYAESAPKSQDLATAIQKSINTNIENSNIRDIKPSNNNIYILHNMKSPSIVVECGFLSNPEEEKLLQTNEYQQKLAFAIYSGIIDYFAQ